MAPLSCVSIVRRLTNAVVVLTLLGASACRDAPNAPLADFQTPAVRADIGIGPALPVWTVTTILPPAHHNRSQVVDISDNGRVVGYSWHSSGVPTIAIFAAFAWTAAGGTVELPTNGYQGAHAYAVSDDGIYVAGYLGTVGAVAARWSFVRGTPSVTVLPTCGMTNTRGFGVNNAGVVVGTAITSIGPAAVKWSSATACPTIIYVSGKAMFGARNINDHGAIVGLDVSPTRGFMTNSIALPPKLMPLPGDSHSDAQAVNDNNEVVGQSWTGSVYTAIYRNPVTGNTIALGQTSGSVALQISDKGRIVWASGSGGRSSKGTALSFLSIVPYSVNACGDIVGQFMGGTSQLYKKSVCD